MTEKKPELRSRNPHHCLSCGSELSGRYCSACGEKVIIEDDKRIRHLLGEFLSAVTFTDSTFWRTLRTIAVRPGAFSRDFVNGRRRPYMKPLSLFLFANLIYFLLPIFNTFHTSLGIQTSTFGVYGEITTNLVNEHVAETGQALEDYEKRYNAKTAELSKILLIVMTFFFSFFLWIIHRPRDTFYIESAVLSLELTAFYILFAIQGQGLVIVAARAIGYRFGVSEGLITGTALILLGYALVRAERFFYGFRGAKVWIRAVLAMLGFFVAVMAYRAFLFFVTFAWLVRSVPTT